MKSLLPILFLLIPITAFIWFTSSSTTSLEVKEQEIIEVRVTPTPINYQFRPGLHDEESLWRVVNNWKFKQDGYKYKTSDILCDYAIIRAREINSDFSHDGFSSVSLKLLSESSFTKIGENLAKFFFDSPQVLQGWIRSESHLKNLKENYTHSCIKCNGHYCVQLFGK